jgi:hypothetical protein
VALLSADSLRQSSESTVAKGLPQSERTPPAAATAAAVDSEAVMEELARAAVQVSGWRKPVWSVVSGWCKPGRCSAHDQWA